MKNNRKAVLLIGAVCTVVLLLSGCLDMETVITVKPDGSGTVEQTFLMQKDILHMLASMSPEGEDGFSLMDKEELEKDAEKMGEGVTFVSAEPYERDAFEGYKSVYSFSDISKLRINQNPGANVPDSGMEEEGEDEDEELLEFVTFSFAKGNPRSLTIVLPQPEESESDWDEGQADAEEMPDTGEMEAMMQMYEKMKISMRVIIDGQIRETNATYRDGSTITLMEMDFGKILGDEKTFKKLARTNPGTLEGLKEIVDEVPGIKVELNEKVEVTF